MQKYAYKLVSIKETILDTMLGWIPNKCLLEPLMNIHSSSHCHQKVTHLCSTSCWNCSFSPWLDREPLSRFLEGWYINFPNEEMNKWIWITISSVNNHETKYYQQTEQSINRSTWIFMLEILNLATWIFIQIIASNTINILEINY